MTKSSCGIVRIAMIACIVLQACTTSPPRGQASSDALVKPPQLANKSALVSERVAVKNSSDVLAGIKLQATNPKIFAKLQEAQALDAESTRLISEAVSLENRAKSPLGLELPFGFSVRDDSAMLLNDAASRRIKAAELSNHAEELRRQAADESRSAVDEFARLLLSSIAVQSNLTSAGKSGTQDTRDSNILDGVSGQSNASTGHSFAGSPNTPKTPNTPNTQKAETRAPNTSSQLAIGDLATESGKIESLVHGSAAVSAPSVVTAGDSFSVFLRVSPEKLAAVMESLKNEFPENPTVKGQQNIKLTPRMVASVSGFGFEIAPKDGQLQAVSAKEATTWAWQAKALESGLHTLTFTLSGTLIIEGKEVPRNFYQYQQRVQVEVSPVSFLEQYWQWLMSTLVIPAIVTAWAAFRKPKNETKHQPSLAERLRERRRRRGTG